MHAGPTPVPVSTLSLYILLRLSWITLLLETRSFHIILFPFFPIPERLSLLSLPFLPFPPTFLKVKWHMRNLPLIAGIFSISMTILTNYTDQTVKFVLGVDALF